MVRNKTEATKVRIPSLFKGLEGGPWLQSSGAKNCVENWVGPIYLAVDGGSC